MRVLVFHGYLLRGTGSNVFNASLAAAFLALGHEVHLLCQERHARELDFVGAIGDWDDGMLQVEPIRDQPCTIYRPNVGPVLPVYVLDDYEGLTARTFPQLTDAELETYISRNVDAVRDVVRHARPEIALANHLVMGPVILARALSATGIPYAVQVHGSALEYTVKPHPRFLPYAQEGLAGAAGVLVGSRHTAESLWSAVGDDELPPRTGFGPPGVDTERFRPRDKAAVLARVRALGARLARDSATDAPESTFSRDRASTSEAVSELATASERGPVVAFVGKLILSKGIDLLLMAWPLVLARQPTAHLAVVGFGAYEKSAHEIAHALGKADLERLRALALAGRQPEGGPAKALPLLNAFLDRLQSWEERDRYLDAAARMPETVTFTGRLEHNELADFLPLCEALVVPSTFPEAFGMVAAEAAACGVLPICAAHSGLAEVCDRLAESLPVWAAQLLAFRLDQRAVESIARSVATWLAADAAAGEAVRAQLAETVAVHYSWGRAAGRVIDAARGKVEPVP